MPRMVRARVEREGFKYQGKQRSLDAIVVVPEAIWDLYGSSGTSQLSFIEYITPRAHHRPTTSDEINATNDALKLANEKGVLLSDVEGTGVNGRVLIKDVRRYLRQN